jgi:hypothetical protein
MSTPEPTEPTDEVPEGAANFFEIPEELGIHPLLLAVLHAVVFLAYSAEDALHPSAAEEALQEIVTYLRRLQGPELQRVRADIDCLIALARQEKWPQVETDFLCGFLEDFSVGQPEV